MIDKPIVVLINMNLSELTIEIQALLDEFVDFIVDELLNASSPIRSISHHIDLILGESFLNEAAYRITP